MYNLTTFYYIDRIIKRTALSAAISAMCLSTIVFMAELTGISRLLFILFSVMSFSVILFTRVTLRVFKAKKIGNGYSNILFIGDEQTFGRYIKFIEKTALKINIEKYMDYSDASLQSSESFAELLMKLSVDEVQFVHALEGGNKADIKWLLDVCDSMGVTSRIILDCFELNISKSYVQSIGTYPVITYHSVSFNKLHLLVKSVIDIIGAIIGLVVLLPVFLLTAIAIKLDSPGPVIFKQKRVGARGNEFNIYKFRSMYIDAEARKQELEALNKINGGLMFKIDRDPRITRVGKIIRKASIDELPQLINVLKHEMSLVGTRPPTLDEVKKYNPEHWRRISIQPGITGMWQVNGRSQILDFDDVVKLDKKYIDEWSILLDIKLLLKTVKVVLTTRGAY